MSQWHYTHNGRELGPISSDELKELVAARELDPTDLVWQEGMADWSPAHRVKNLFNVDPATALTAELVPPAAIDSSSQPIAVAPIPYFSPTIDLGDKAAAVLRGFGTITGRRGDWPLSEHSLQEFAVAAAARNPIRRASRLYMILGIVGLYTVALFTILFLMATRQFVQTSQGMPVSWAGSILIWIVVTTVISVVCFFASRATYKCRIWAPVTMIVIFSAWIVFICAELVILIWGSALEPDTAVFLTFNLAPPTVFLLMSIGALVNIRRFLRRPLWSVHLLVNAKL